MNMADLEGLSERDRAVLRSIFDPTATIAADVVDDGDSFPEESEEQSEAYKESASICAEGVKLAEAGKLDEALKSLNKAIEVAPDRAETYNNRAQLLRLLQRDDDAMADLDRALELTADKRSRARALALCQRGVLLRRRGDTDNARAAFTEAAKLGSGFAKKTGGGIKSIRRSLQPNAEPSDARGEGNKAMKSLTYYLYKQVDF